MIGIGMPVSMNHDRYYRLKDDGKSAVACTVQEATASRMDDIKAGRNIVATEKMITGNGCVAISTVFCYRDLSYGLYPKPKMWETAIFGGSHNGFRESHCSYEEAVISHRKTKEHVVECDGRPNILQRLYGNLRWWLHNRRWLSIRL